MGVAEVEFEDNSSLRLGPNSMVEFPQLERLAGGATASSARLVKGMVYVSLLKTRGNEFTLLFGQQKIELPPASHVRLQVDGTQAKLAVLDGTLHIDGLSGSFGRDGRYKEQDDYIQPAGPRTRWGAADGCQETSSPTI